MKTYFIAGIKWFNAREGGRTKKPAMGARYCPILDIETKEKWSIDFICPDFEKTNIIRFSFLVDEVPIDRIEFSKQYFLYEGDRRVAMIVVEKREILSHTEK